MQCISVSEGRRYTSAQLAKLLHCTTMKALDFVDKLAKRRIIRKEYLSNGSLSYIFDYVGLVCVESTLVKVFPKFIRKEYCTDELFTLVFRVLKKYSTTIDKIFTTPSTEAEEDPMLSIISFLIDDYTKYGLYTVEKQHVTCNTSGKILWNRTISSSRCIFTNKSPVYTDLYTVRKQTDDGNIIRIIHKTILSECCSLVDNAGLGDLFHLYLPPVETSEIEDFWSQSDTFLEEIERALAREFRDRELQLLEHMKIFIERKTSSFDNSCITSYGTSSFHCVWEEACARVFSDKLRNPLASLNLPKALAEQYSPDSTLISLIEKPCWIGNSGNGTFRKYAQQTLIPDIVTIDYSANTCRLVILDAKYYSLKLHPDIPLQNHPGIGDVSKQYLYQLAFEQFMLDHDIREVKNAFLMPSDSCRVEMTGCVELPMLHSLGLENILVRKIPASSLFEAYLQGKTIPISWIGLDDSETNGEQTMSALV